MSDKKQNILVEVIKEKDGSITIDSHDNTADDVFMAIQFALIHVADSVNASLAELVRMMGQKPTPD